MEGKKYGLIIGINKYMQPGADLNGCVNDAEDMWKMITDNYGFYSLCYIAHCIYSYGY